MDIDPYGDHVMWEIEEIRRNNISRRRIKRKNIHPSKLNSLVTQYTALCKNELPEEYIQEVLEDFQSGYIYYDAGSEELIGLCLWKTSINKGKQNAIDLLLLCSRYSHKKLGHYMLNDLENYAFESKQKYITVLPANESLISYYASHGFVEIQESKSFPKRMIKELNPFTMYRKRNRKTRKRTFPRNSTATQPLTANMMPLNLQTRKNNRFL